MDIRTDNSMDISMDISVDISMAIKMDIRMDMSTIEDQDGYQDESTIFALVEL